MVTVHKYSHCRTQENMKYPYRRTSSIGFGGRDLEENILSLSNVRTILTLCFFSGWTENFTPIWEQFTAIMQLQPPQQPATNLTFPNPVLLSGSCYCSYCIFPYNPPSDPQLDPSCIGHLCAVIRWYSLQQVEGYSWILWQGWEKFGANL